MITQSSSLDAFKAGLAYLKDTLELKPEEIVIDPHENLTGATIAVFGAETKYKT
jgi:hypothetical protein